MGALTVFTAGTKGKASEVNGNFNQSYYGGALKTVATYGTVTAATASATEIRTTTATRVGLLLRNNGSNAIYVGTSTVSTTAGKEVLPTKNIYIQDTSAIYAIAITGTVDVRYVEVTSA